MTLLEALLKIDGKFSSIEIFKGTDFEFEVHDFNGMKDVNQFEISTNAMTLELESAENIVFTDNETGDDIVIPASTTVNVENNHITVEDYTFYFYDKKDLSFLNR